jgi:hypothetical protein
LSRLNGTGIKSGPAFKLLLRLPIPWTHVIGKEELGFKELEHVLIEKVEQLFKDML